MSRWRARAETLGRVLFPPRCLVCGERGAGGQDLCTACRAALPWNRPACRRCALPLARDSPACGGCRGGAWPFETSHAAFRYAFPMDRLLPRFKFHADLAAGRLLSQLMLDSLADAERPMALLPVPLHLARLRQRGYDQALELARPLARRLALPLCDGRLWRRRTTAPQSELGARDRQRNVRGAFELRAGVLPAHVALVDDVMTTGATLAECGRALKRAGVLRVDAWVVARAAAPGS